MSPIFLLVTGCYETYAVRGVYTDSIRAAHAAEAINAADPDKILDARIETIPLNPDLHDVLADALWLLSGEEYTEQLKDYEQRKSAMGIE